MKVVWPKRTLGSICEFVRGPFGGSLKKSEFVSDGFAVYEQQHAIYNQFESIRYFITDSKFKEMQRFELCPNDLIMSCSGTMGRVAIVPNHIRKGIINQALLKLTPSNAVVPEFLKYWMDSAVFQTSLIEQSGGAAIQNVASVRILKDINIFLPPLSEQQRIVAILDEAFEAIAAARINAEQNRQNARALFESYLQSVFSQCGEGWVDTTIGADVKFIDYRGKTPVKTESGVRLITAKNVKMGYIQETPMEFIASEGYSSWMTRGIPKKGDVLFTTEAPLANVAQLDTDEPVAFAQRVIIMQPNATKLNSTFLKYLLLSQPIQQRIRTKGTGATVQGIKASLLKQIDISFPPSLSEQQQIVEQLDSLRGEAQHLESLYQRKIAALDELKQSLLQQAFSGQL